MIKKLKELPKRSAETRARQLKLLIEKYTDKGKIFIMIINKDHLLNERILLCFKSFCEMGLLKNGEKEPIPELYSLSIWINLQNY